VKVGKRSRVGGEAERLRAKCVTTDDPTLIESRLKRAQHSRKNTSRRGDSGPEPVEGPSFVCLSKGRALAPSGEKEGISEHAHGQAFEN